MGMLYSADHGNVVSGDEWTPLLRESEKRALGGEDLKAKRSGKKERKVVCIMAGFLGLVVVGLLSWRVSATKRAVANSSLCLSPSCVHASSEILYNLSPDYKNIDPCTNFEELVCGGWGDRHDLRADQGDVFTGTIMSEASQMLLRHILEAPYPDTSDHSSFSPKLLARAIASVDEENFDKLKDAYNACMDEDMIKEVGVAPLLDLLNKTKSTFSAEKASASSSNSGLSTTILYLEHLGIAGLVSLGTGADDKDPDNVVIYVNNPRSIGLPAKDYYKDAKVLKNYEDAATQVIGSLLPDNKAYVHDVIELEKKLAASSPDAEDQDDVTKYYNIFSLTDADALTPQIGLASIIKSLVPSSYTPTRVLVTSPSYMKALTNIISNTSAEILQTYFLWKVIQAFSDEIEADAVKPYGRFRNELAGKDPDAAPERYATCINHVDDGLGWILSRFFVEKAFSAKAKEFGDQIVSDIKEQFIEKLKVTEWMDDSVKGLAIDKVHKIIQKIGYPTKSPNVMDPPTLEEYYTSVNITNTTFFDNYLSMNALSVSRSWSAVGKPVDRDEWGMTVPTVNAYYNPPGNEIVFPAGIMQFPVFDVDAPQYLSYGAFGSVSGHELSHAFDSTGRHYDQNGNYTDWWSNSTVEGFEKRAQCFIDQYSNFTVEGPDGSPLHVNGKLTLGENIADAGGVSAAFAAYKKRAAAVPNQDLPGLDFFTQDQLFFVFYSNWWCGKSRKETAINRIYTDPHAPKWARIMGTMANSRAFRDSFKCPVKEPTCELW